METYSVDDNGGKHGSRNSGAVLGIVGAAYEFMVIAGEDTAEDGEDDDGEDGDDDAVGRVTRVVSEGVSFYRY